MGRTNFSRDKILELLKSDRTWLTVVQLSERLGKSKMSVRINCQELADRGILEEKKILVPEIGSYGCKVTHFRFIEG